MKFFSTGSSLFLGNSRRHGCNRVRNQRLPALRRTPHISAWKQQLNCHCFIEEVTHALREWKEKRHGREVKKLPVVLFEGGRRLQYVHDGQRMWTVEAEENSAAQNDLGATEGLGDWLGNVVQRLNRALQRSFVPEQVRPHYLPYLKWKLMSRFFSSILHVQCTQVLLLGLSVSCSFLSIFRISRKLCAFADSSLTLSSSLFFDLRFDACWSTFRRRDKHLPLMLPRTRIVSCMRLY